MEAQNDEELVRRTRNGDSDAFSQLWRRHQAPIYRFALRMSGSTATADEVVQDTFLAVIRTGHNYQPASGPLQGYLFGIARRCLYRHWSTCGDEDELDAADVAVESDPLEGIHQAEQVELLRQALQTLPPHYREVVVLCGMDELTYAEAAELLDLPVGTIRSRMNRAKTMLFEKLSRARVKT